MNDSQAISSGPATKDSVYDLLIFEGIGLGREVKKLVKVNDDIAFQLVVTFDLLRTLTLECYYVGQIFPINPLIKVLVRHPTEFDTKFIEKAQKHVFTENTLPAKLSYDITYEDLVANGYIDTDSMMVSVDISECKKQLSDFDEGPMTQADGITSEYGPSPYAGLINQGDTCYMNSMIQSLFFINQFRHQIYHYDFEGVSEKTSKVIFSLQVLFARMQTSKEAIPTNKFTDSLNMESLGLIGQRDIQEFARKLMDIVGDKSTTIFKGKYRSFIQCTEVDFKNIKDEDFLDISLVVRGCANLEESFEQYLKPEMLDDKYDTEKYGKQPAQMGSEFVSFPDVLYIQLKRFEYDPQTLSMTKVNDQFTFPKEIDLGKYLAPDVDHSGNNEFELFGVLVHSGSPQFGHYYAYLRTNGQNWYKFNDSHVVEEPEEKAIDRNFGGSNENGIEKVFSAYILIYARKSKWDSIFMNITDDDIGPEITQRMKTDIEDEHIEVQQFLQQLQNRPMMMPPIKRNINGYQEISMKRPRMSVPPRTRRMVRARNRNRLIIVYTLVSFKKISTFSTVLLEQDTAECEIEMPFDSFNGDELFNEILSTVHDRGTIIAAWSVTEGRLDQYFTPNNSSSDLDDNEIFVLFENDRVEPADFNEGEMLLGIPIFYYNYNPNYMPIVFLDFFTFVEGEELDSAFNEILTKIKVPIETIHNKEMYWNMQFLCSGNDLNLLNPDMNETFDNYINECRNGFIIIISAKRNVQLEMAQIEGDMKDFNNEFRIVSWSNYPRPDDAETFLDQTIGCKYKIICCDDEYNEYTVNIPLDCSACMFADFITHIFLAEDVTEITPIACLNGDFEPVCLSSSFQLALSEMFDCEMNKEPYLNKMIIHFETPESAESYRAGHIGIYAKVFEKGWCRESVILFAKRNAPVSEIVDNISDIKEDEKAIIGGVIAHTLKVIDPYTPVEKAVFSLDHINISIIKNSFQEFELMPVAYFNSSLRLIGQPFFVAYGPEDTFESVLGKCVRPNVLSIYLKDPDNGDYDLPIYEYEEIVKYVNKIHDGFVVGVKATK